MGISKSQRGRFTVFPVLSGWDEASHSPQDKIQTVAEIGAVIDDGVLCDLQELEMTPDCPKTDKNSFVSPLGVANSLLPLSVRLPLAAQQSGWHHCIANEADIL